MRGQRYHVKNPADSGWVFTANQLADIRVTVQLLARVTIAKIEDEERMLDILRNVPVDPSEWDGRSNGMEPRWTCRIWVLSALKALRNDGIAVGTNVLDKIEGPDGIIETTKAFVSGQMANQRYDSHLMSPKPMLNMMTGTENYVYSS